MQEQLLFLQNARTTVHPLTFLEGLLQLLLLGAHYRGQKRNDLHGLTSPPDHASGRGVAYAQPSTYLCFVDNMLSQSSQHLRESLKLNTKSYMNFLLKFLNLFGGALLFLRHVLCYKIRIDALHLEDQLILLSNILR